MASCNCGHSRRGDGKGKGSHFCIKIPIYKNSWKFVEDERPKFENGRFTGMEKYNRIAPVTKLYWKCTRCGREFPASDDDEDDNDNWKWCYPLRLGKNCSCLDH
jgi:hypothetical protein